ADRSEVERRDRKDEAFERSRLELVPHTVGRKWLLTLDLLGKMHVPSPEIDRLTRRVDLGLMRGLRLAEHGRRGQDRAITPPQKLGSSQKNRRVFGKRRL